MRQENNVYNSAQNVAEYSDCGEFFNEDYACVDPIDLNGTHLGSNNHNKVHKIPLNHEANSPRTTNHISRNAPLDVYCLPVTQDKNYFDTVPKQ